MKTSLFVRFYVSRLLATLGDQVLLFTVPLIVYTKTKSVKLAGLAFFIEWIPRVLSLPIAGTLSDRFGGKIVYLLADATRAVAALLAFCLLLGFSENYFLILSLMMAVSAFFYAQSFISMESMIPRLVDKESLPKAQSILQAIEQASLILGPLLGAGFIIYFDAIYLISVAGIFFFLAFLILVSVSLPNVMQDNTRPKNIIGQVKKDFIKAWKIVRVRSNLLLLIVLSVNINLIIGIAMATAAMLATGYFGVSGREFGLQQSFSGAITLMVLAILPFMLSRINIFYIGVSSYIAICLSAFFIGVTNEYWVYVWCYAVILASGDLFNVYIRSERVLWIPKVHLGKTIGLIVFMNQLTLPISGIIVSAGSNEESAKFLFWILGLLMMIIIYLVFARLKFNSKILVIQTNTP